MTKLRGMRLWLGTHGRMVCEREDCCGPELLEAILNSRNTQNMLRGANDEKFAVMNPADLAEIGALLKSQGKELSCDGGHVTYDVASHRLQMVVKT